jgi:hypothetical protein
MISVINIKTQDSRLLTHDSGSVSLDAGRFEKGEKYLARFVTRLGPGRGRRGPRDTSAAGKRQLTANETASKMSKFAERLVIMTGEFCPKERKMMKLNKFSFLFSAVIGLFLALSAAAQTDTFSDANVDYSFDIPNATWKMTAKPSQTSPNVEYVYGDRSGGYLEVRKLSVKADDLMADVIGGEEEKLKFLQGYVAGKEENFSGNLRGTVFNFEFVRSGRNMSGRFYFLKASPTIVYVLRFTGLKEKLITIRNQTDSIARTFEVKKS